MDEIQCDIIEQRKTDPLASQLFNCLLHENSQRYRFVRADKSQFCKSILLSLRSENWISTRHWEVELLIKACTRISFHQNPATNSVLGVWELVDIWTLSGGTSYKTTIHLDYGSWGCALLSTVIDSPVCSDDPCIWYGGKKMSTVRDIFVFSHRGRRAINKIYHLTTDQTHLKREKFIFKVVKAVDHQKQTEEVTLGCPVLQE